MKHTGRLEPAHNRGEGAAQNGPKTASSSTPPLHSSTFLIVSKLYNFINSLNQIFLNARFFGYLWWYHLLLVEYMEESIIT